eukprot:gene8867-816_t
MDSRNGTAFRGVSIGQDSRFSDKMKKTMKNTKFPDEFNIKLDFKKIQMGPIKSWISKTIEDILGIEDEILIQYIFELLQVEKVDPREIQINLNGFLDENAPLFVEELWKLLVSANSNSFGIPQQFLDKERDALEKEQKDHEKIEEEIRKKSNYDDDRNYRRYSPERRRRSRSRERRQYSPDRRRRRRSYSRSPERSRRRRRIRSDSYSPRNERSTSPRKRRYSPKK